MLQSKDHRIRIALARDSSAAHTGSWEAGSHKFGISQKRLFSGIRAPLAPARRQARMIMPVARRARASWSPGAHGTTPDSGCSRPPAHRLLCAASWQQGDAAARARTHRARNISPLRLTAEVASMRTAQAKPLPCVAHAAPTQGGPGGACDEPLRPLTGGPGVEGDGLARGCPPCAWWL